MSADRIPEDQRYIVFPIEDPDTGRIDECGWEWMSNGRDDPMRSRMSAADDYPVLANWSPQSQPMRALAEIDALRAENARLKAQLADARDADAALHDHITNGGRI